MSAAAQALGVHVSKYEFEGTTYSLSVHDLEDYAKYELSLEEAGWAALKRARKMGFVEEYEYKEFVREFLALLSTHQLTFGTEDYIKSTQTLPGIKKMLELSIGHLHPQFKRDEFGLMPDEKTLDRMVREDLAGVHAALRGLEQRDAA